MIWDSLQDSEVDAVERMAKQAANAARRALQQGGGIPSTKDVALLAAAILRAPNP
jgi:phosphoribosylformimino-5-aminoimidazole carboxamide ribonucleotide (ProFAR) isomerase